jgi:histidinol-phosphate aminotransferase
MNIRKLVRPCVRSLRAYQAEEIACRVKLDANESPYGRKVLKTVSANRYPDPEAKSLRILAAKAFRVRQENILHGNGSDELIYYLITTFGGPVLYPVPTFSMYGVIAQSLGAGKIEIPLGKSFELDSERMLRAVQKRRPKLIFLSTPNNPTGNRFSEDVIVKIIRKTKGLVVVDEAYHDFAGGRGALPLIGKYRNMIVLKTLSKIGLAALRTGFMVADTDVIQEVNKVRLPFNLNSLSQKVAAEALKNRKKINSYVKLIISERKRLFREMGKIKGVGPYPSDANFILFRLEKADDVYRKLMKRGVLVRNMRGAVNGCLRVTVGTPKENDVFLKSLEQIINDS